MSKRSEYKVGCYCNIFEQKIKLNSWTSRLKYILKIYSYTNQFKSCHYCTYELTYEV